MADAEKLLVALNWHGVAMVEFKLDPDGQHWLMEINPRFWGSLALAIDAGVDFPMGLLRIARGEKPVPQPAYLSNIYTRDLRTDVEWFKANLKADHHDPLLLTRPRFSAILELFRPVAGIRKLGPLRLARPFGDLQNRGPDYKAQVAPIIRRLRRSSANQDLLSHHQAVLAQISHHPVRKIAFICLGNICRSPLAAHLAQERIAMAEIVSAGFHHKVGRPSPDKMVHIGSDFGIDLARHRSQLINAQLLKDADLILVMDSANMQQMEQAFPEQLARTTMLGLFASTPKPNIPDPYTESAAATLKICLQIREAINGLAVFVNQSSRQSSCQASNQSGSSVVESLAGLHRP